MQQKLSNQLQGYLKIRITGYSPERFLNLCKYRGIEIWGLESKSNAYEMYMTVKGFRELKPILRKTRTRITILERYGVPFFMHKYRKRKVFFAGIFLCIGLILFLSKFIWNIKIDGNQTITDHVLLEYLRGEEVYAGMKIKDVKCEEIVTNIRKQFDDIIWVSASLEGCNLIIAVRENTDTFQVNQTEEEPCDIVASTDGVITEIITRSGVPCVNKGDTVVSGDLLVSGTVEVKNDAGEVVREDYKAADADVYAECMIPFEEICENTCFVKQYEAKKTHRQIYLNVLGYHFTLGNKRTRAENQEQLSQETQLKLNDSFLLPVSYGIHVTKDYELVETERSAEEKKKLLNEKIALCCKKLEESGCIVQEKQIQIIEEADCFRAKGFLKVIQPIGTVRKSVDFQ